MVVCKLLYQVPMPLLESPEVRYQLKGHQSLVGHDDASSTVQSPQWQFSIAKGLPVLFIRSA